MQLRESIHSTKKLFHNTIQNLKSIFFGGYQKLTKHSSFNPFSCGSGNVRNYQTGQYYEDFFNELECDLEKGMKRKSSSLMGSEEPVRDEYVSNETDRTLANSPQRKKQGEKEEMNKKICRPKKAEEKSSKNMNESGYVLAQKMKELEMMDVSNVEHVLDVEEALHYYSRLKSPVYQDIVDEFFTDMYTEFSVPQAAASINSSKRRIESIRMLFTWIAMLEPVFYSNMFQTLGLRMKLRYRAVYWLLFNQIEYHTPYGYNGLSYKPFSVGADDEGGEFIEPFKEDDGAVYDDGKPLISAVLDDEDGDPVQEDDGAVYDDGKPVISVVLDDEDGDPVQESDRAVDGDLVPSKEVEVGCSDAIRSFQIASCYLYFCSKNARDSNNQTLEGAEVGDNNSWYNQQYGEGR
ncbi:hypothetical protein DKX38_003972 [Salix brachista]|uniref:Uncharacterized protein n=1 Tax=Salix brachista TaxID=2182728 RepID=A0A5N5NA59_9ROSI|nr:hypothetical protein DKX38_003972 [Salix brachista]